MKTTQEFFEFLFGNFPSDCNIVLTHPAKFKKNGEDVLYHVQESATSAQEAARIALQFSQNGFDSFFGISLYKDNHQVTPNGKQKTLRTKKHVYRVPVLIADIDCGEGKDYLNYKAGATAAQEAMAKLGIQSKYVTLIKSGGGVHLYIKLETPLAPKPWEQLAAKFKSALINVGLHADPSKTTDVALILRPLGTRNYKKVTPRPVELIQAAALPIEAIELEDLLNKNGGADGLSASLTVHDSPFVGVGVFNDIPDYGIDETLTNTFGQDKPLPHWSQLKCPQLLALEQDASVPEPLWYQALGVAAYTRTPQESAIVWSQKYEKFNKTQTLIKMNQYYSNTTGPSTCKSFETLNPDLCKTCPFKGRISSPVMATIEASPLEGIVSNVTPPMSAPTQEGSTFSLPPDYRISTRREIVKIVNYMEIVVSDYVLFVASVARKEDIRDPQTILTIGIELPSGVKYLELEASQLLSARDGGGYQVKLLQMGVAMSPKKMKSAGEYLIDAYQDYQRRIAEVPMISNFGWSENYDGFYIGERLVKDGKVARVLSSGATAKKLGKDYMMRGNLNSWKAAVQVLSQPGMESLAFALLVGFAAPLYTFTNLNGMTVNYYSELTGTGKSTACKLAQSIFGNPEALMMEKTSSQAAIFARLGTVRHLPVLMDEISDASGEKTSDLLYSISTGRERDRSTISGELRDSRTWSLIMMTTSNKSLHDKLDEYNLSSSGQKARLLELMIEPSEIIDNQGEFINTTIANNYGLAAEPYISYLVDQSTNGTLRNDIAMKNVDFQNKFGSKFSSGERFIRATVTLAWYAGLVAKELGLLPNFDIDRIINNVLVSVSANREKIINTIPPITKIIGDYLAERSRFIIQNNTYAADIRYEGARCWIPDEFKGRMDVQYKTALYNSQTGHTSIIPTSAIVTIPVKALKDYCKINRIPMSLVEKQLEELRDYVKATISIMAGLPKRETVSGAPLSAVVTDCYRFVLSMEQIDVLRSEHSAAFIIEQPVYDTTKTGGKDEYTSQKDEEDPFPQVTHRR